MAMYRTSYPDETFTRPPAIPVPDNPKSAQPRVAAACDECRAKKVKCDGLRPGKFCSVCPQPHRTDHCVQVCSPCATKLGVSAVCRWGLRKRRSRGVSKTGASQPAQRLLPTTKASQWPSVPERDDACTPVQMHTSYLGSDHGSDANAMMGLVEDENQGSVNRFGDSSATGFMAQIKKAIDQQITSPGMQQPMENARRGIQFFTHGKASEGLQQPLDYVLPPRQRADYLLEIYWRLVDTLYPFLDKTEVQALYRRLWTGEAIGNEGAVFISLLNIVFSIASAVDGAIPPDKRESSADVFYQRARELLNFGFIRIQSVMTVQCFLLLGQFLQSTNDPQQCWNFVGLAIRMAQSLGLDLPSTSAKASSLQHSETLRKVWHGCVLMDRTLSMIFCRPSMITSRGVTLVPLPAPCQDSVLCPCSSGMADPDSGSSDCHFCIESLKLYEIINEALLNLYNSPIEEEYNMDPYMLYFGSPGAQGLGLLFERDKSLCLWLRNIPIHLRRTFSAQNHGPYPRQATILKLRYYYVRILLYRPVLQRFCSSYENEDTNPEEAMPSKIALQCSLACLNTAFEVIELFDSVMEGREQEELDGILPAWWYSIFYIYSAATVLIAGRLHPAITAEVPEEAIIKAWRTVMKIMTCFQRYGSHAKRSTAALNVLFDQVPQQHRKHRRRLQQPRPGVNFQQQQQQAQNLDSTTSALCNVEAGPADSAQIIAAQSPPAEALKSATSFDRAAAQPLGLEALNDQGPVHHGLNSHFTSLLTDPSYDMGLFDALELQLSPGDMSWLSSVPY